MRYRLQPAAMFMLAAGMVPGGFAASGEIPPRSPDSELQLLFTRQQDRQDDLYVLGLDSSTVRRLTNHRAKDSHGTVSADGSRIVFNSERAGWWKIWTMDADGGNVRQLTFPESGADYYPTWSPDGRAIAYASGSLGNGDIVVMGADGSKPRNLTDHDARDNFPAWSPDGRTLAFASDRDGDWAIYVVAAEGGTPRKVSGGGQSIEPAWFPDSRRIVYQSDAAGSFDLWIADVDGSTPPRRLTDHRRAEKRPAVSPDGRWIAFESDRTGGSDLFVVPADGGEERRLTAEGYNFGAAWFPASR